jgi:hypothetical protein
MFVAEFAFSSTLSCGCLRKAEAGVWRGFRASRSVKNQMCLTAEAVICVSDGCVFSNLLTGL